MNNNEQRPERRQLGPADLMPAIINLLESAGVTLTLAAVVAKILLAGSTPQTSTNSEASHDQVRNPESGVGRRTVGVGG
jgi:hypothetical protein